MKPKLIKILVITFVLGLLALGGAYAGYRGYKSLRQARLVKEAKEYLAEQDPRKALLCLQRALRYNNRDIEATRLMAQLVEAAFSPAAPLWRSRVVELNPGSLDDRLALAQTAIRYNDYAMATNALEGVDAAGKKTAAYHNIAGATAAAANLRAKAEAHFLEAARLEPANAVLQLNLSVVRLQGTNLPALAEARDALTRISANPTNSALRCQALRELTGDALRQKKFDAALTISEQLQRETNSSFRDRCLQLEVLQKSKNKQLESTVAAYQVEASTNVVNIVVLGLWQGANLGPARALTWLQSLPPATRTNLAVAKLAADLRIVVRDWQGLKQQLDQQNWGELEFLRHAYRARALRGQDLGGGAKAEWELALNAAAKGKEQLKDLVKMAAAWNWESEGEEVLWTIVNRYAGEKWAFRALNQILYANGRTLPLMKLYNQELKRSPSDLGVKNNLAVTALLLDAKEIKPHDLAREVYQQAPTNAAYVSTYGFSLHLQGKNPDALKVFQSLNPKALEDHSIAGYYGLVLKASGDKAKARIYLDWAFKGQLLPEEKKMFEQAKAGT